MVSDIQRIWLILEGRGVRLGRLEILKLANILVNFQKFVFDYGKAKGVSKKDYLKLFLENIEEGSVRIRITPVKVLERSIPIQAVEFLEELNENLDDLEKSKELVISEYKHDGELIIFSLKKLEEFWSQKSLLISVGIGNDKPEKLFLLPAEKRSKIVELRKEFEKRYASHVKGVILESKFYGAKRRFEVITPEGEIIKCYYDPIENPELEEIVYAYIKRTVEVTGIFEKRGRARKMNVIEIKEWDSEKLENEFAGYKLRKPISLKIEYDNINDVWCLENKELELYGCGETLGEAKENLKSVFETLVEEYLLESDEKLSEKAVELKRKLSEFVEVKGFD